MKEITDFCNFFHIFFMTINLFVTKNLYKLVEKYEKNDYFYNILNFVKNMLVFCQFHNTVFVL